MELKALLLLAERAAIEGGKEILKVYNSGDFEIEQKEDQSPLTLADRKAHLAIIKILKNSEIPVLSEEGKEIPYKERKNWQKLWIVDPLDGTKEFIKRNGEFTVNIALIENGVPILGVIYVPVKDQLYAGALNLGARKSREWTSHKNPSCYGIKEISSSWQQVAYVPRNYHFSERIKAKARRN